MFAIFFYKMHRPYGTLIISFSSISTQWGKTQLLQDDLSLRDAVFSTTLRCNAVGMVLFCNAVALARRKHPHTTKECRRHEAYLTHQLPFKRLLQYTLLQCLCLQQALGNGFFYLIANGEFAFKDFNDFLLFFK